jgi:hypothetical protein
MSHGYSGAGRQLCRRRRWLAQLPEDSPQDQVQPLRRARSKSQAEAPESSQVAVSASPVSSIIPRPIWALSLLVGCGLLTWAAVVGLGVWLDLQQIDPWRDIFGLQSGRLLRFFNTTALLTCSQLSFLILWRRSRSRKDFSGRYRVWFWVGAVCSCFCVATVTRFHERWANALVGGSNLVWVEAATVGWLVPATTLLLSAMHLLRRDLPFRSASRQWVQASRILAVIAGVNLLIGSQVWPSSWVTPINEALCALWPTVFASMLLVHARFVTYVTNEASRESLLPRQPSRWEKRVKAFARHVAVMASEEWQIQRAKRAAAKAARASIPVESNTPPKPSQGRAAQTTRRRSAVSGKSKVQAVDEVLVTKAVNLRPISRPTDDTDAVDTLTTQPIHVHPAQPIPPPHFEIGESSFVEQAEQVYDESPAEVDLESESPSTSIPVGYSPEQWRSLSKKERKRLLRAESTR